MDSRLRGNDKRPEMHELKLCQNIVTILERETQSDEVGEVKTVYLEVGEMRYIVADIMTNCFKHVPKSDKLKNARLDVEVIPGKDFIIKGIEW